jgi:hypothetical protein
MKLLFTIGVCFAWLTACGQINQAMLFNQNPKPTFPDYTNNLAAWWNWSEDTGTTSADLTANANTATLINSPTWSYYSVLYNGVNQESRTANHTAIAFERTQPFSISTWAEFNTNNAYAMLESTLQWPTGYRGWELSKYSLAESNVLEFFLVSTYGSSAVEQSFQFSPTTNQWYHLVATYDGSSTAAGVLCYSNAILMPRNIANQNNLTTTTVSATNIAFAERSLVYNKGMIGETRIYSNALTAAQVLGIYTAGLPKYYHVYAGKTAKFFGDSVTVGQEVTNITSRYSTLLCTTFGMTENNQAVGATQIGDAGQADNITTNTIVGSSLSSWMTGYNDGRLYGTNASALDVNNGAVGFLLAWMAIPTASRITSSNTAIGYIGTWGSNNNFGSTYYCSSSGATAKFTNSGTTLFIGFIRSNGNGAPDAGFSVTVDGSVVAAASCATTAATTPMGRSYWPALLCISNLSNTSHNVALTSSNANYSYLCWYAMTSSNQTPQVFLASGLKCASTFAYTNSYSAQYTNGSDAVMTLYATNLQNVVNNLASVGLNIKYVQIPDLLTGTNGVDYWDIGIHPGVLGHAKIYTNFLNSYLSP